MAHREYLEEKIEYLRTVMYEASQNERYDKLVKISQELDDLLNKLSNPRSED
ncbi:aspartyl-phosphate phosphatase Spo0E family protein [Virgibacillus xinjiangensis]|uniref:Aspartyl-phosphate phosphatase Spo0E family protein n=1 Tax=Virgibacillus xinjiangensis TaxID=393090 RepID=A0ABV7CXZ4_9BACI